MYTIWLLIHWHVKSALAHCLTHTHTHTHRWTFLATFGMKYAQVVVASSGRREFELHWHSWHSLCADLHTSLAWLHMALSLKHTHTHTFEPILALHRHFDLNGHQFGIINQPGLSLTHTYVPAHMAHTWTPGMLTCGKVWMLLVMGRSHWTTYRAAILEAGRGRERDMERENEWEGQDTGRVCVCVCVCGAFSWGLSAIIGMNLKTGRGVPLNKTSGRQPQFHFLF